jgi:hypothetical protein
MSRTYYVGLDVHKETVSIAYTLAGSRKDATYQGQCKWGRSSRIKIKPERNAVTTSYRERRRLFRGWRR